MAVNLCIDVTFTAISERIEEIVTDIQGEGSDFLPRNSENMIYQCAVKLAEYFNAELPPFSIQVVNRVPLARGLGSSASAIVGGLCAANLMLGSPADEETILSLATSIEGHPDNVAPALLGGLVVSSMVGDKVLWVKVKPPEGLQLVVAIPSFPLSTHAARGALPGMLLYSDAVFNVSRSSLLVAALSEGRMDLLRWAMEDRLHQPYRKKLVPGMDEVFEAAMNAGAHGVALSGAGPSLIAFVTENDETIGTAMQGAWSRHGIECTILRTTPATTGVRQVPQEADSI
jgi:homoserine kinase